MFKRIGVVLEVQNVRPSKLKRPTPDSILNDQLGLRLKQDSHLRLVVEGAVETTVVEIDKHDWLFLRNVKALSRPAESELWLQVKC